MPMTTSGRECTETQVHPVWVAGGIRFDAKQMTGVRPRISAPSVVKTARCELPDSAAGITPGAHLLLMKMATQDEIDTTAQERAAFRPIGELAEGMVHKQDAEPTQGIAATVGYEPH